MELVQIDSDWVRGLTPSWTDCARWSFGAAVLIGVGVLRHRRQHRAAGDHNRRAEIEGDQLVGGSDAFVRRPFLYTRVLRSARGHHAVLLVLIGISLLNPQWAGLQQATAVRSG